MEPIRGQPVLELKSGRECKPGCSKNNCPEGSRAHRPESFFLLSLVGRSPECSSLLPRLSFPAPVPCFCPSAQPSPHLLGTVTVLASGGPSSLLSLSPPYLQLGRLLLTRRVIQPAADSCCLTEGVLVFFFPSEQPPNSALAL